MLFNTKVLKKSYALLAPRRRKSIIGLSLLSIPGSLFEIIGLGSIPAFLYLLFSPEVLEGRWFVPNFVITFFQKSPDTSLLFFSLFIISVFVLKNIFVIKVQKAKLKVFYKEQTRISKLLFEKYLSAPFLITYGRNSSEYLRNLNSEVFVVFNQFLIPFSNLFSDFIFLVLVFTFLLFVNFWITILSAFFLLLGGYLFFFLYQKKLKYFGREEFHHRKKRHKIVTEAFGGLKEIVFYNKLNQFAQALQVSSENTAAAMQHRFMAAFKIRPFIEIMAVAGILLITLFLTFQNKEPSQIMPLIALFAATAIRLLPVFKNSILNISMLKYNQASVNMIINDLNDPSFSAQKPKPKSIYESNADSIFPIKLNNIEFSYPGRNQKILYDISFEIPKGAIVGITGKTGAGKSTITDLIAGIFPPEKGSIKAGKHDFLKQKDIIKNKISYTPQNPFLLDDTIEQNITFSSANDFIDKDRLLFAVENAQLGDFIGSLPEGLLTMTGEKGVRLSAGQIQRIGIARAIYANPEFYIFDESTSALDVGTERLFINSFVNKQTDKSFLFVTHRIQLMKKCTFVVFLENGMVSDIGDYNLLKEKSVKFNRFLAESQ